MKKILPALVLAAALVTPMIAAAQVPTSCTMSNNVQITGCPTSGACDFTTNNLCGLCCVMNAIYTVTNWIFIVLIAIVAIMVIWGGLTIVTAGGAPEKVSTGRSYIVYAVVGFALALLSKAIPALVRSVLGVA